VASVLSLTLTVLTAVRRRGRELALAAVVPAAVAIRTEPAAALRAG
jgi:hypothetical protein